MRQVSVFEIAAAYVEDFARLDPIEATLRGLPGHDGEVTDYSPAGAEARAELDRRTLLALESVPVEEDRERIAREVMRERLQVQLDAHAAGEHLRELRILASPSSSPRRVFDQMPATSEQDWETISQRLQGLPRALASYQASLEEGLRQGMPASARQALAVAHQAEVWGSPDQPGGSFFHQMIRRHGAPESSMGRQLEQGAAHAADAYLELKRFLRTNYAPRARTDDGVGAERYQLASRQSNGMELNLEETYAWGWEELHRVEAEMARTADKILPGAGRPAVAELLATDPGRCIVGKEAFQAWLQELHERAIEELDGNHFDVPAAIRHIEAIVPPPGGELAASYTAPAEDFSRSGRTWWPTGSATVFPKWDRVTTVYHEGVPGHHIEIAGSRCLDDRLSRFQKTVAWSSGYGEGWALYAERLMGELGYLENPDYYYGMLSAQALRCVRVIVDLGMHLELPIPAGENFHPGKVWTHDLALEFAIQRTNQNPEFLRSEIMRYLGWPAQAISYKVGEREWLRARETAQRRLGPTFDLKRFHTAALSLGPLPLAMLQPEIDRALSSASGN